MLWIIFTLTAKVLLGALLLVLVGWVWLIWKFRKLRAVASKLPDSLDYPTVPILGHLYYKLTLSSDWSEQTERIFFAIEGLLDRGLESSCLWVGPVPYIGVWGPEDIKKLLTSPACCEKAIEYSLARQSVGLGLVTAPDYIWRVTRRHANPVFHKNNLEQLTHIFNEKSRVLVKILSHHLDGPPCEIMQYLRNIVYSIMPYLIAGSKVHIDMGSEEVKTFLEVAESVPGHVIKRILNPFMWSDAIYGYFYKEDLSKLEETLKVFRRKPKTVGEENAGKLSKNKATQSTLSKRETLMDGSLSLLESYSDIKKKKPHFPEKIVQDEILTTYTAGAITLGSAIASSLLALAQHQEIQERLYEEITSVIQEDEDITYANVNKLVYLNQVYLEMLRFFNIFPIVARSCSEDVELSNFTVPAGSTIVLVLAGLHMNKKFYPNPKIFDPDRFSPDNSKNILKTAYVPFSGGPRFCIGKALTEIVTKTMVVHVLRHYKLATKMNIQKIKRNWNVTLTSNEGYHIKVEKRQNQSP